MLRRISELMATPFARPPGRRRRWTGAAPEWCALVIYLAVGGIALFRTKYLVNVEGESFDDALLETLHIAAAVGYSVFAVCITVFPLVGAALTFASERGRGTLEAMVLTPLDGRKIAALRWLHVVAPWLRLFAWMLPLYFLIAGTGVFNEIRDGFRLDWEEVSLSFALALMPKGLLALLIANEGLHRGLNWSLGAGAIAALRVLGDLAGFLVLTGGAYLCSVRFTTAVRALVAAFLLVFGGLCTVLAADVLGAFALTMLREFDVFHYSRELGLVYYAIAAPLCLFAKLLLGLAMALLAVLGFNAWALREKRGGRG